MGADRTGADRSPRRTQAEVQRDAFEAGDGGRGLRWWGFWAAASVAMLVWVPAFIGPIPDSRFRAGTEAEIYCSLGSPPWFERFAPSITVPYSCEWDCDLNPTPTLRFNRTLIGWELSNQKYKDTGCGMRIDPDTGMFYGAEHSTGSTAPCQLRRGCDEYPAHKCGGTRVNQGSLALCAS